MFVRNLEPVEFHILNQHKGPSHSPEAMLQSAGMCSTYSALGLHQGEAALQVTVYQVIIVVISIALVLALWLEGEG